MMLRPLKDVEIALRKDRSLLARNIRPHEKHSHGVFWLLYDGMGLVAFSISDG